MYESLCSQFFRITTGIQSGPYAFGELRFAMTFLIILRNTETLCSFRLVLEGKTGKETPESSNQSSQKIFQQATSLYHLQTVKQRYSRFTFVGNTISNSLKAPGTKFLGTQCALGYQPLPPSFLPSPLPPPPIKLVNCPSPPFQAIFRTISALKIKICLYGSFDCYGPVPGGQATFYGGHQITVLIWPICFSKGLSALDVRKKFKIVIFVLKIY